MKINLKCLTFLMTYKCTSECKHCLYRASPYQDNLISLKDVKRDLRNLKSIHSIDSIYFFGGEPLLYFELLVSLIQEVKKLEIPNWETIGIITNGFWGKNDSVAKKYAKGLKEAGLNSFVISVDAFHQEFVPIDAVKGTIRAAKEVGIEWIKINGKSFGDTEANNHYNQQTKRLIKELEQEFDVDEIDVRPLMVAGRAADTLAKYLPMIELTSVKCKRDDIRNPTYIEIDPNGWVWICCGIAIGNTRKTSISEIIRGYEYKKHPILCRIGDKEPVGLLELAIEKGYKPLNGYAGRCHLCFSVRRFLRPFYPEILVPAHVYQ
ncbi:MAG: radical SAM protein [Candidatus Cloacimonadota bacterium]|nr:MAG: radical SAM protein [Candidatus Cloacimonadota bacterium]